MTDRENAALLAAPLSGRRLTAAPADDAPDLPRPRLDRFVADDENKLLVAVVNRLVAWLNQSAPENPRLPDGLPSPLVLVGPSGSGKTHLAGGLAELGQAKQGGDACRFLTARDFNQELAAAIHRNQVSEFRKTLRACRLLVVDDAHLLGQTDLRQEELRHALDALLPENQEDDAAGGFVLLTSAEPLADASGFGRSLLSRLAAGLVLPISPPGAAARRELLASALASVGGAADEDALQMLADQLPPNPATLLGAAGELRRREGSRIDVRAARRLLEDGKPAASPPLRDILRVVARYYKTPLRMLTSASRRRAVVAARSAAIYLARELTPMSYEQIGQMLGGRDHTTIMHSYRSVANALPEDRALASAIEELRRLLRPL